MEAAAHLKVNKIVKYIFCEEKKARMQSAVPETHTVCVS